MVFHLIFKKVLALMPGEHISVGKCYFLRVTTYHISEDGGTQSKASKEEFNK